ncbi:MAG: hypothetical protein ACXVA9_02190 [Bdellovibrionales bacterium]
MKTPSFIFKLWITAMLLFSAQLHAVGVDFGKQKGWKFNDLVGETRLQSILKGAVGTIVKTDDRFATVMMYVEKYSGTAKLGQRTEDWKSIVVGKSLDHGGTIKKEVTFKVDGQWRYFIQSEVKDEDGQRNNVATMALVKDGHVVVFTFQQDPKFFNPRIKSVVDLYFDLKIDKT